MIKIFNLCIVILFLFVKTLTAQVKTKQQEVYNKIVKANLRHPKIVLKQAIHESGNFKSNAAVNKHNILGIMRGSHIRRFRSIDECIKFYRDNIQSRYNGGNYYRFLKRIGYATDENYLRKVRNTPLQTEIE